MEYLVGWVIFAVAVAIVAETRGRLAPVWFLVSFVLSPLLGLVILLALPKMGKAARPKDAEGNVITDATHVRCPDCRELVRNDARKCKHCGTALVPQ